MAISARRTAREVGLEFFHQQRDAVGAPAGMADRVLDHDFREFPAVLELDSKRIRDGAFFRVVVILGEALVL
ncbi:MAG TPA: hypothetical protein VF386_03345, partial [Usitatibacter sp.]